MDEVRSELVQNQHVRPSGFRAKTGRYLRLKLAAVDILTSAPVDALFRNRPVSCASARDVKIDAGQQGITPGTSAALYFGIYEAAERRCVLELAPSQYPVVELGSGIGFIASLLIRKIGVDSIICVEANPALHGPLEKNLLANNIRSAKWTIVRAAIDSGANGSKIAITPGEHLSSSIQIGDSAQGKESIWVPTTTLRSIVADIGDFALVADIEGAEVSFIGGDGAALERCRWMCIELHDTTFEGEPWSRNRLMDALIGLGFELVHRDGATYVFTRD